jgi:putative membrane protein
MAVGQTVSGYDLPVLNAALNGSAALLLTGGYFAIKAGLIRLHKTALLTALATSAVFLASYLYYHGAVRHGEETKYTGEWRSLYVVLLVSHIVLAAVTVPLALTTAWLGLSNRLVWHKRIARVTLPIWLYVSITGVVVYLFLKDLYPTE